MQVGQGFEDSVANHAMPETQVTTLWFFTVLLQVFMGAEDRGAPPAENQEWRIATLDAVLEADEG